MVWGLPVLGEAKLGAFGRLMPPGRRRVEAEGIGEAGDGAAIGLGANAPEGGLG